MASRFVGGIQRRAIACVCTGAGSVSEPAMFKRRIARAFRSASVSANFMALKVPRERKHFALPARAGLTCTASDNAPALAPDAADHRDAVGNMNAHDVSALAK